MKNLSQIYDRSENGVVCNRVLILNIGYYPEYLGHMHIS